MLAAMENTKKIKKVQLNVRVAEPIGQATRDVSERAFLKQEVIIADAIRHFFGIETREAGMRRRLCVDAFKQIHGDKMPFNELAGVN